MFDNKTRLSATAKATNKFMKTHFLRELLTITTMMTLFVTVPITQATRLSIVKTESLNNGSVSVLFNEKRLVTSTFSSESNKVKALLSMTSGKISPEVVWLNSIL